MTARPQPSLILGIETSCDETAAAIVRDGDVVMSSVIASQHDLHAEFRGVVPEIASRAHAEQITPVIQAALRDAGVTLGDITAVAVGNRPGLIGSLLVGVAAAKALAWSLSKPLIAVDHVHAHLYAGLLRMPGEAAPSPPLDATYPALGLVVSGGHTAVYSCESPTRIARLGATIDDAMGEAFDKVAAILDLGYPGGPALDRLASSPDANDRAFDLPISRLGRESLNFSFSGLKTAVLYAARGVPARDGSFPREAAALSDDQRRDLAASFQRAAVESIILKLGRVIESNAGVRALLVGGGVSANSRLRASLEAFAAKHGIHLSLPPLSLCVDNAAMIAGLAHHHLLGGDLADLHLQAHPTTSA